MLVVSYESLRIDKKILQSIYWHYCILDEAQRIKNCKSQAYEAAIKLSTEHKLVLSGTPMQNNLQELWSLFNFVEPNLLGDLQFFEKEFVETIMKGGFSKATNLEKEQS